MSRTAAASRRAALGAWALWAAPLAFLALFYFYPLGRLFAYSFGLDPDGAAGAFAGVFASARLRGVLGFTFGQAAASTALTLLVGLPGAWLLARRTFPGRALLRALTGIPFMMPTVVVATGFNALLGPRGWLNLALMSLLDRPAPPIELTGRLEAILLAHVFYNTTIVLRMVGDFLSRLDPRTEQAARMLGAGPLQTLRRVTLPLLAPAIGAAALLVFLFNFSSFGVVLILGGPRFATLEVEIYRQAIGLFDLPTASALALLQLAFTLTLSLLYLRMSARRARPLRLAPMRLTARPLRTPADRLRAALVIAVLLALLIAPLAALAARSVTRQEGAGGAAGLTLDYYRQLGADRRQSMFYAPPLAAVGISLVYAAATVALALGVGLPAAWALARRAGSLPGRLLDPLLMLPLGTSAVTLGLGFILALGRPPLDLRASPVLVPLVHTLVAFPFVVRSLVPALRSIRPQLRQAAAVLGASPAQATRRVDLPLMARAVGVGAAFAFMISLGEFGATALIARPEFPTLPLAIYRLYGQAGALNYGQALALSTILMALCGAGMLAVERLRSGPAGEF